MANASKAKGTRFESAVRDYLRDALHDFAIDRRVLHGTQDMGDLYGIRSHGCDVVAECKAHKDVTPALVAKWRDETLRERGNADADAAVLVIKRPRRRVAECECQMTVGDYLRIAGLDVPLVPVGWNDRAKKTVVDEADLDCHWVVMTLSELVGIIEWGVWK